MGVVSPIGCTLSEFSKALREGRSGVGLITQFDPQDYELKGGRSPFPSQIAAEVAEFHLATESRKVARLDRASQFALAAARNTFEDAGLDTRKMDTSRIGVVLGTGMGDMKTVEWGMRRLDNKKGRITPTALPKVLPSSLPSNVAIDLGITGPTRGISTACASSTHSAGDGYWLVRRGEADMVLIGGADAAITPLTVASFAAMGVLSCQNDSPESASRPFDRDRDGFVIGEGSGMLLLESLSHARRRKARIYAELVGYGSSCDAFHLTGMEPDAKHCARAIRLALEGGEIPADEVDYVNAHGSSTRMNDLTETKAIKEALGLRASEIPVSATKSMLGHLLSAAGGVELVASTLALSEQVVHPTLNLENPDPDCDLDYVSGDSREYPLEVVVKNSFGLGGHNAVIVLRRW